MPKENINKTAQQSFWGQLFSANPQTIVTPDNFDKAMPRPEKLGRGFLADALVSGRRVLRQSFRQDDHLKKRR
jgi:hypothetical protein